MSNEKIQENNKLMAVVYKIINTVNGKFYIGCSTRFQKRKKRHLDDLKSGKHHNKPLQRAFHKYGVECFSIIILEEFEYSSLTDVLNKEQHYLDTLLPHYNVCVTAGSQLGSKRTDEFKKNCSDRLKGKPTWNKGLKLPKQSDETKRKRAKSLLGSKRAVEVRKLMSEKAKGRKFTDEHKLNLSKSKIKYWKTFNKAISL